MSVILPNVHILSVLMLIPNILGVIKLGVIMLGVIMLNVIIMSVTAPYDC
jgi:hypothetical protein